MNKHLVEDAKIVQCLAPAADAAGRTGAYISLKNARRVFIVCSITQGNAATVALTPYQATNVAAAGEKVLAKVVPIWADLDTATSDALARAVDAVNYTTDAAVKNKVVVFCVEATMLDVDNGFDCLVLKTGASNAANITQALYILDGVRFGGVTPPSAIVD